MRLHDDILAIFDNANEAREFYENASVGEFYRLIRKIQKKDGADSRPVRNRYNAISSGSRKGLS
jgi:hypothetical protein